MVYNLDAKSKVKRGSNNAQTSLWPDMWKESKKIPHPPSITMLKLAKVTYTHRAIILQLGALVFQVCVHFVLYRVLISLMIKLAYLTHTSVQIFTREIWEETVQLTHQKVKYYWSWHTLILPSMLGTWLSHWSCVWISTSFYHLSLIRSSFPSRSFLGTFFSKQLTAYSAHLGNFSHSTSAAPLWHIQIISTLPSNGCKMDCNKGANAPQGSRLWSHENRWQ